MVHFEEAHEFSDAGSLITQAPQSNPIHATINALSMWMSAIQPRESWYLSGWITDSPIDFLVDPGAVVSAISLQCYERLVETDAILTPMKATLRSDAVGQTKNEQRPKGTHSWGRTGAALTDFCTRVWFTRWQITGARRRRRLENTYFDI